MHSKTIEMLDRLEKASWFSRVGIKDGPSAAVVASWPEAIEYCSSPEWEDLQLEASNQFCERIAERSRERWRVWNETVREVNKVATPLVDRKIATVIRENSLPKFFRIQVNHDICSLCMENEYADICPPSLFTRLAYWYIGGHFPCGWWGAYPEGKVIVY